MLKLKYLDSLGAAETKCTALTFSLKFFVFFFLKIIIADSASGCYYFILPNDKPTPPKYTNQILYLLSYSGVFPTRQRSSLKVENSSCMWLLMKPTVEDFSLRQTIRSGVNSKYWNILYVMRISHCISIARVNRNIIIRLTERL